MAVSEGATVLNGSRILEAATASIREKYAEPADKTFLFLRPSYGNGHVGPLDVAIDVSTRTKARLLEQLGLSVVVCAIPRDGSVGHIGKLVMQLTAIPDLIGAVVQNRDVWPDGIPGWDALDKLDLDARSVDGVRSPAVVEAAMRLVDDHRRPDDIVGIVGAKGYVGRSLERLLDQAGAKTLALDFGDDLGELRRCAVVISAVSSPQIICPSHLSSKTRIAIDISFFPAKSEGELVFLGGFHPDCSHMLDLVTPVPGGMGPLQVAVLLERLVHRLWGARERYF